MLSLGKKCLRKSGNTLAVLPREVMGSLPLEVIQNLRDVALRHMVGRHSGMGWHWHWWSETAFPTLMILWLSIKIYSQIHSWGIHQRAFCSQKTMQEWQWGAADGSHTGAGVQVPAAAAGLPASMDLPCPALWKSSLYSKGQFIISRFSN